MTGTSVVICCYNSSSRLSATMAHIAAQHADMPWELIVVDNASADNTADIAKAIWTGLEAQAPLKVVTEPKPGLSFAREAGIKIAQYDIIVFCDDDNHLAPGYLQKAYEIMSSDANIGICGGIGEAVFDEGGKPGWFDRYSMVFACGKQVGYEGILGVDQLSLYGAGMVVRKRIFENLWTRSYAFNLIGRKGKKMIAGEDFELCILARALGFKLYYSEELKFKHYMPSGRMQWKYLIATVHGSALSSAVAFVYSDALRYKLTGEGRYKVNWFKDILKAINAARFIPVRHFRDLQLVWTRLSGGLSSVIGKVGDYGRLKKQIEDIYDSVQK